MNDGIILKGVGGLYHVWVPDCACVYRCGARGIFRKELRKPLIGDAVSIEERNDAQKTAAIV
ncbi:MAG TPA: ribosome small subunit-dependent GTPase A, partial [Candidatus Egerieisoma faecipullorum]|nr:ribosome small subunit-dependent GTPase A [Candidatus Egerieisoma faecipullorum]